MKQYKVKTRTFIEDPLDTYIIGIDPGTSNGVSVYSTIQREFVFCKTYKWWDLIFFLENLSSDYSIIIEDIIANKPTFKRGMIFGAIKSGNPKNIAMSVAIFDKFAQNIGGTKRDQEHIVEWLDLHKITTHQIVPKKNSKTKLKHDEFVQETGILTKLNEHTRDSVMLVLFYLSHL